MWSRDSSWLDFNMSQTSHFIGNCSDHAIGVDYALTLAKPAVVGEGNFENIPFQLKAGNPKLTDYEVRRPAYSAMFARAMGHIYGANEVYMFWDPGDNDYGAQADGWGEKAT